MIESASAGAGFAISVVVGNPKPASRTHSVACRVGERISNALSVTDVTATTVVELADLAPRIFDWAAPDVRAAVDAVSRSHLAVIASPTYKASYTGLLKAFLDWFSDTSLEGVVAIPTMLGATPRHALAVEHHLRPTLVELGAVVPTRGLYVVEADVERVDADIDAWLEHARPALDAIFSSGQMRENL